MWFEREIEGGLLRIARTFPVVVVVGPRQVGKTAVVERVFRSHGYVSLDLASLAELAEDRPDEFLARYPAPVVIDEVQYAPALFRHIKHHVDRRPGETGLFVLTGSQNYALMAAVAESLAGRAAIVPLQGFSAAEWRAGVPAQAEWRDLLWRGAYPGLWADPERAPDRDRWYQAYVATYLERDVRNLMNVGSLRDFERFLRACAARCGQTLNVSEVGRDVGVSTSTARNWLSVLQASNVIALLEPYYRSLGRRLAKSPKLFFVDTGLAAFLMGFQEPQALWASPYAGALWETHVMGQWLRWRDWHHPAASLWYWRDQAGHEVDLLIEINQQIVAVESKLTPKPDAHDLAGLRRLRAFYGDERIASASIACTTPEPYEIAEGVWARNGWTTWDVGV